MIFGFVTDNKKQKQIIKIFIYLLILLEYKVYIYTFLLLAACLPGCLPRRWERRKQASKQTDRKTDRRRPSSNCWGSFGLPPPSARARKIISTASCSYFLKPSFFSHPLFSLYLGRRSDVLLPIQHERVGGSLQLRGQYCLRGKKLVSFRDGMKRGCSLSPSLSALFVKSPFLWPFVMRLFKLVFADWFMIFRFRFSLGVGGSHVFYVGQESF